MAEMSSVQIALIPSPGMGHIIPFIELAKRLARHHRLRVTLIFPSRSPPSAAHNSVLQGLPSSISYLHLPPVNLDDLPPEDNNAETVISVTVARSVPSIRGALESIVSSGSRLACVVLDLFGTPAISVAREFNAAAYVFFASTAMTLSLLLRLPALDETVDCEFRYVDRVEIPGCSPIHGGQLLDPVQDRKSSNYKWMLQHAKSYAQLDGILENSFAELENGAFRALREPQPGKPPVYFVGPLVNVDSSASTEEEARCLRWLDDQPHRSVLYVCFGSGGTLTNEQMHELALGLEMSEQRFLWVVRSPSCRSAHSAFFTVRSENDPFFFLPKGFLDRTEGRGMMVDSWAPQACVLKHAATAGFLSHCGWNSVLESIVHGVPLIAWPLYAEQKMNAIMLTEEIGIALRPRAGGIIGRDEISVVVRDLMEGEAGKCVRDRVKTLKDAAARALSENDGSSTGALSQVVSKWINQ